MSEAGLTVAVVGAGAVGCYYGFLLAKAGHAVTLIGRPALVEAVRERARLEDVVGDALDPTAGVEAEGHRTFTLWGEMAAQIGDAAFEAMAANDTQRTAPGTGCRQLLLCETQRDTRLLRRRARPHRRRPADIGE